MFATSAAIKAIARREVARTAVTSSRAMASLAAYEDFGKMVFTGKVADEYLKKHGCSAETLKDPAWVKNDADAVANAVFDW
jgi:glutamine synthetase